MTFEGLSAEGMFWMKVGSREQQCLRSCYLHCFLEYPLTIFSPPVNDEHGVCADHDPNIGYQVNVLVRNHNDPRSNFPGQCWLNQGRTVELRHHIFSNLNYGCKTLLNETKASLSVEFAPRNPSFSRLSPTKNSTSFSVCWHSEI